MYRTHGANSVHRVHILCSAVKQYFTHFQFTFNIVWDKPINHLAWEEEQYQLIHATNLKHIIFVIVIVFTEILNLKMFWVVFVLNTSPSSFQNPAFQSKLCLSYLLPTNRKMQGFSLLTHT